MRSVVEDVYDEKFMQLNNTVLHLSTENKQANLGRRLKALKRLKFGKKNVSRANKRLWCCCFSILYIVSVCSHPELWPCETRVAIWTTSEAEMILMKRMIRCLAYFQIGAVMIMVIIMTPFVLCAVSP